MIPIGKMKSAQVPSVKKDEGQPLPTRVGKKARDAVTRKTGKVAKIRGELIPSSSNSSNSSAASSATSSPILPRADKTEIQKPSVQNHVSLAPTPAQLTPVVAKPGSSADDDWSDWSYLDQDQPSPSPDSKDVSTKEEGSWDDWSYVDEDKSGSEHSEIGTRANSNSSVKAKAEKTVIANSKTKEETDEQVKQSLSVKWQAIRKLMRDEPAVLSGLTSFLADLSNVDVILGIRDTLAFHFMRNGQSDKERADEVLTVARNFLTSCSNAKPGSNSIEAADWKQYRTHLNAFSLFIKGITDSNVLRGPLKNAGNSSMQPAMPSKKKGEAYGSEVWGPAMRKIASVFVEAK